MFQISRIMGIKNVPYMPFLAEDFLSNKFFFLFGQVWTIFSASIVWTKAKYLSKLPLLRFCGVIGNLRFLNIGLFRINLSIILQFRGSDC